MHVEEWEIRRRTRDLTAVGALVNGIAVPTIRSPLIHIRAFTTPLGLGRTTKVVCIRARLILDGERKCAIDTGASRPNLEDNGPYIPDLIAANHGYRWGYFF